MTFIKCHFYDHLNFIGLIPWVIVINNSSPLVPQYASLNRVIFTTPTSTKFKGGRVYWFHLVHMSIY